MIKDQNWIVGQSVEVMLYVNEDSFYYFLVNVWMELIDFSVELSWGKKGIDCYFFYYSLYQMNIDVDFLKVFFLEDLLVIGCLIVSFVNKVDVIFEFLEYFDSCEYS